MQFVIAVWYFEYSGITEERENKTIIGPKKNPRQMIKCMQNKETDDCAFCFSNSMNG